MSAAENPLSNVWVQEGFRYGLPGFSAVDERTFRDLPGPLLVLHPFREHFRGLFWNSTVASGAFRCASGATRLPLQRQLLRFCCCLLACEPSTIGPQIRAALLAPNTPPASPRLCLCLGQLAH